MSDDDSHTAGPRARLAASLRQKRRICLTTMWLALTIAIVAVAWRNEVPQLAAVLGPVAIVSWLAFAGSIAYLEGLSGSGDFSVFVVFLFSAGCPPLVGLPVAWMVNGRVKARIRGLEAEEHTP